MKLYYALHKSCNDLHYVGNSEAEIEEQHQQCPEYRDNYGPIESFEAKDVAEAARLAMQLCFD